MNRVTYVIGHEALRLLRVHSLDVLSVNLE